MSLAIKSMLNRQQHWAQMEELGIYWLMRFAFRLYRVGGRLIFRPLLYPVVSYYFVSNRLARQASLDFLQHVETYSGGMVTKRNLFNSYRHFLSFADSMVDKLGAWTNRIKIEDVVVHNRDIIKQLLDRREGCVILVSHLGNVEISRALATIGTSAKLNILVHTKHARQFNRLLKDVSGSHFTELIQVTDISPMLAISLDKKIAAGEFVFIVGDRVPVGNSGRTLTASFLGDEAQFAQGPYILAALMKCKVYTLFCLKQQGVYHLYFDHFSDRILLPRKNREAAIAGYVQVFSGRLQKFCLMAPLQWFNFYLYWQQPVEHNPLS